MNLVLATMLVYAQGTAHNVASLLPKTVSPVASPAGTGAAATYDEAYSRCLRSHAGASACRRSLQPSG